MTLEGLFRSRAWLLGPLLALQAACGGGGGGDDGIIPPPTAGTLSGRVTYDRVPLSSAVGSGLDYVATFESPVRQAIVELLDGSSGAVLATTVTDTSGNYSFAAPANTRVQVRVKAQSRVQATSSQPASWNLAVYNNTNGNALYALDSSVFDTGTASRTLNLRATSGWQGFSGSYDPPTRTAGPFAILDTAYEAVQFMLSEADATLAFPALGLYWSPNNRASDDFRPSVGSIGTTSYRADASAAGAPAGIYVLGLQNVDTDEYDAHVIAHEFQHYLEDRLGRTDTTGGSHSLQEKLDLRLAFSEGYSNAFAAMVLSDPLYRDSFGSQQGSDSHFSLENSNWPARGWFIEASVQAIVWDLYDTANEAGDTASIGFAPIWSVMREELASGAPLTSIFPFIVGLKSRPGVPDAAVDALVENQGMVGSAMDAYATTETNDGGSSDTLPVYSDLALNGPAVRVCGDASLGTYNRLGNRRFLRFSLSGTRAVTIRASYVATPGDPLNPVPDPDIVIFRSGFFDSSEFIAPDEEVYRGTLDPGDYVLEVYEYSHIEPDLFFGSRPRTCMNVTLSG
jgi:hypothetical protein